MSGLRGLARAAWGHASASVSAFGFMILLIPHVARAQAGIEIFVHGYNNFADTDAGICVPDGPATVAIGPSRDCTAAQLCVANRCAQFAQSQDPGFDATQANLRLTPDPALPIPGNDRFRGPIVTWTPATAAQFIEIEVSGSRAERYLVGGGSLTSPVRVGDCVGTDIPTRLCGGSSGLDIGGIYLLTVRLMTGEQASIQFTPRRVQGSTPTVTPTFTPTPMLPAISSIVPSMATQDTRGLDLIINGANFKPGFLVRFEPSAGITLVAAGPPNFGFESPARIRQRIHIANDAPVGPRQVFVTNPDGQSGGVPPNNRFNVTAAILGPCFGDCGRDGRVTIDEIVRGINIALGAARIELCFAMDIDNNNRITIEEIISAINAALRGCVPLGTPVPTASPTHTPEPPGGECCQDTPEQTCSNDACRSCVCTADQFCCTQAWDNFCIELTAECPICGCPTPTPNPDSRDCCVPRTGPGCDEILCEDCVCARNPSCCEGDWNDDCAADALFFECRSICACLDIEPF